MARHTARRKMAPSLANNEAILSTDAFETDAEKIIEEVFHRQRWTANLRDKLAERLAGIVAREASRRKIRGASE